MTIYFFHAQDRFLTCDIFWKSAHICRNSVLQLVWAVTGPLGTCSHDIHQQICITGDVLSRWAFKGNQLWYWCIDFISCILYYTGTSAYSEATLIILTLASVQCFCSDLTVLHLLKCFAHELNGIPAWSHLRFTTLSLRWQESWNYNCMQKLSLKIIFYILNTLQQRKLELVSL